MSTVDFHAVTRTVPVDGGEFKINLVPTSVAADMARQNPTYLGSKFKECWLRSDGSTVREMLTPNEPTQERHPFRRPVKQVVPRPKSPTASPPPLVEAMAGEVQMGEHPGPAE